MAETSWEYELQQAITSPEELFRRLDLNPALLQGAHAASTTFALKVPKGFVARMQPGNLNDPLLRQVLPLDDELKLVPGFSTDPLNEPAANPLPGLLHKYHGRVLLTLVGICAVNCRYCFRRHFAYADNNPGMQGWDKAIAYIANDSSIEEVILSGGDPLVANDRLLTLLTDKLQTIAHVKRLRIHTRLPIVLPERISSGLLAWLQGLRFQTVMVIHCNHAQEIDETVRAALVKLAAARVVLLNQAVLLKGVNDSVIALQTLSETLFAAGVLPYYLHMLDKVEGSAHFEVSKAKALTLHQSLGARLSGFLVPKLVYEQDGAPAKIVLS